MRRTHYNFNRALIARIRCVLSAHAAESKCLYLQLNVQRAHEILFFVFYYIAAAFFVQ